MDICELILFQHHEQRRMFALLDELGRGAGYRLAMVWRRLAILLEVHAEAEEKFFYPRLLEVGAGAGGQDSAASETKDAIKDHNEIRDAVADSRRHQSGSEQWWRAVNAARKANGDHMAEEEREDLADFRRRAGLQLRHDIAVEFFAYEADHAGGIDTEDHDPQRYVDTHG